MSREKGRGNLQSEASGRWTMRVCVNGRRLSRVTYAKSREAAEEELRRFVVESRVADHTLALADTWAAYESSPNRRDLRASTLSAKYQIWRKFIVYLNTNRPDITELREVNRPIIERYLAETGKSRASTTYNNRVCVLREVFHALSERAGITDDPWAGVRFKPDDCHSRRSLTCDEVRRLIAAASRMGREWRELFELGIYTGMRLGDCCRLEWKNVDLVRGIIQIIPHKTAKFAHGRPVTIPIHPILARNFAKTPIGERNGPIIKEIGALYFERRTRLSYCLKQIFKSAGITTSIAVEGRKYRAPEATFHSLRHTFVSIAANAGVPLHVVQSIVGHGSTAMTRHYYHENEDVLRKAVIAIPSMNRAKKRDISPTAPELRLDDSAKSLLERTYTLLKTIFDGD